MKFLIGLVNQRTIKMTMRRYFNQDWNLLERFFFRFYWLFLQTNEDGELLEYRYFKYVCFKTVVKQTIDTSWN